MAKRQKKLAAATLARRINQWHEDLYGNSVFDSKKSVAEFIEDVKQAEFEENMRQIPGQTRIKSDDATGDVEIEEDAEVEAESK